MCIESSGCKRYEPSSLEKELDNDGHLGQKDRQTAVEDACVLLFINIGIAWVFDAKK